MGLKDKVKGLYSSFKYHTILRIQDVMDAMDIRRQRRLFLPDLWQIDSPMRTLSLAAHPDDDVLGAGGTLALLCKVGSEVKTVCLTDGAIGCDGKRDHELANKRKAEALDAASLLGISAVEFLEQPDQKLEPSGDLCEKLAGILKALKPQLIFLPFFVDYHHDHLAVTKILLNAMSLTRVDANLVNYECVAPIFPNRLVDITSTIELKANAIKSFASQLQSNDYINTIPYGLNRFRSYGLLQGKGFAEAFFITDASCLEELFKACSRGM